MHAGPVFVGRQRELAELRAGLEDAVGGRGRFRDRPALSTSPRSEHARLYLFDAVATLLRSAAQRTPLVLVLDDLQWADAPSLLLLQFLAHELRDVRILLLGTYREVEVRQAPAVAEILGALGRDGHHVPLRGLGEEEVRRFLEETIGRSPAPVLVRAVHRETEGNPFFVDEIVRLLVAERALERHEDPSPGRFPVPQGVREAIRRRLAPLPPPAREALALASVVGREFDLAILHRACGLDPEALLETLGPALAREIVVREPGGVGRYRFAHALIRETLYEELGPAERIRLHGQIGEVLEEVHRTDPTPHLTALAHHFLEAAPARGADKALVYSTRAGRHAAASLAYEAAAAHFQSALEVLGLARPGDERERCELLLARGDVQGKSGDGRGARETFQQAAEIARRIGDAPLLARSALGFAGEGSRLLWVRSGVVDQPRIELLEEALHRLGDGDPGLRAQLLARLGHRFRIVGFLEHGDVVATDREIEAWAQIAGELRQPLYLTDLAMWRATRAIMDGRFADGEEQAQRAVELGQREPDVQPILRHEIQTFLLHFHKGCLDQLVGRSQARTGVPATMFQRCARAFVWSETGRQAEARRELSALAKEGFPLPRDGARADGRATLSRVDPARACPLAPHARCRRAPWRGRGSAHERTRHGAGARDGRPRGEGAPSRPRRRADRRCARAGRWRGGLSQRGRCLDRHLRGHVRAAEAQQGPRRHRDPARQPGQGYPRCGPDRRLRGRAARPAQHPRRGPRCAGSQGVPRGFRRRRPRPSGPGGLPGTVGGAAPRARGRRALQRRGTRGAGARRVRLHRRGAGVRLWPGRPRSTGRQPDRARPEGGRLTNSLQPRAHRARASRAGQPPPSVHPDRHGLQLRGARRARALEGVRAIAASGRAPVPGHARASGNCYTVSSASRSGPPALRRGPRKGGYLMRAGLQSIAIAVVALALVQATASRAAPDRGTLVCTWGGTPDAPTGVITFSPGVTDFPSTEPIEFTATGELGGGEGCTGVHTFRGVADPGTSCLVGMPLHATAMGFPPIAYVEGTIGVVGTAPIVLYDRDGNVVGSEQAQFLTDILNDSDCNTPEGLTRAYWSDTLELFAVP